MTDDAISIEAIEPRHIDGFHAALDAVAKERKYLTMLEASPLDSVRAFVLSMIEGAHPQFVAVAAQGVVGWCDIRREQSPVHAHRGRLGMGIVPDYRGRGLGRRLIETTLGAARERGLHRVELDVYADNARAIALYERVGFLHEGRARYAAKIDGRFIDTIHMALIFRPDI